MGKVLIIGAGGVGLSGVRLAKKLYPQATIVGPATSEVPQAFLEEFFKELVKGSSIKASSGPEEPAS